MSYQHDSTVWVSLEQQKNELSFPKAQGVFWRNESHLKIKSSTLNLVQLRVILLASFHSASAQTKGTQKQMYHILEYFTPQRPDYEQKRILHQELTIWEANTQLHIQRKPLEC